MTSKIKQKLNRVLLVDDDANLLESYRRVLRSRFEVYTALGGHAGLSIIEAIPSIKVVVSDIKMPKMTGVEFLSRVREVYPETIRMVLTGYADMEIAISSVNRGDIFRFLTKPCDVEDLVHSINDAIEQYDLYRSAKELAIVNRIKEGLEGTLRAFTRLVEFRDPYTAGHMDRTAGICALIADELGLDKDTIQALRLAALVHDIGKIAVPAGILNKPGTLNDAEFALIKAHPLVGADIFSTLDTEWPISRLIVEHHERLDGTGYPNGLLENQIHPASKILQVADSIDAMVTNRPYRQMLEIESVLKILEENRGTKLDSECVDAGIKLLRDGVIIGDILT